MRELAEEVGVEARVDRLVGVFARGPRAPTATRTASCRSCTCATSIGGALRPQPHEVAEIAWRHPDDIEPGAWHHHHETLARAAWEAHWRRVVDG